VVLVDLIPRIIDTPRVIRTLGKDGSEEMKQVNQEVVEKDDYGQAIKKMYDLSTGTYDVVVASAPNFQTLRQEAQQMLTDMAQGNPQLMQIAGDIIMKTMDFPYADEMAERLKKALPPGLAPADEEEGPQMPPEVQMQIQQMQEQMQQMDQALQQAGQELQSKQGEEQYKMAQLQIENRKVDIQEMEAQAKIMQASQKANVNVSAEIPHNPETDLTEADKLEIEIAAKQHDAELARQHDIRKMVLQAKLSKEPDSMDMEEIGEDGEEKPSEMACHMAEIQQGILTTQSNIEQMSKAIADLAAVNAAPKKYIYDDKGNIIGSEVVI
jgi:hypothetical protein